MIKVDNAVIMAAGTSSRFAPISYEKPKALVEVKGEILIERQIRQLQEAGVEDIYIVTGYKAEELQYLKDKFGVKLRHNPDYATRNNNASIKVVEDILKNSYICCADNYFPENPFAKEEEACFYAAPYIEGPTQEWCITTDENDVMTKVVIGGRDSWIMMGHVFWDEEFTKKFLKILDAEYDLPETAQKLWEDIYLDHMDELVMKIKKYDKNFIFEFDTLDELRAYDKSYVDHTRSKILQKIAEECQVSEGDIVDITTIKGDTNEAIGCRFKIKGKEYSYYYKEGLKA